MRHLEVLFNLAGQSFFFDPPEGRASGTPTVTVYNADTDDDDTAETATTGSCSVDSVNTTVNATASAGASTLTLLSGTGVSRGSRYLLTNPAGEREWVECKGINGTAFECRHPIKNDQTTASTFQGCRISIGVNATWMADSNNITEWQAGFSGYRLRWSYTVASVAYLGVSYADLVRYSSKNLVSPLDVDARFPGWIDRLPTDYQQDQGAALVEEAHHGVRMDAIGDGQVLRRLRNTEILRELVIHRANFMAMELQVMAGAGDMDRVQASREAYDRRYNQLVTEPKAPTSTQGGASILPDRLGLWRR